ncbi:MAG: hypothetical protein COV01_01945 [Candidatus Taylorbacteria bacterium CG10_big_fil_rev_8_21_14_0_10_41_48]|uniref:Uncharacterized protein n=1 Tax=Candidatus Taylorbacteria bacterium CG10_big_fil_rev_8_21_14_0_10_41_48 TaxID=1975024 RepID=A0A2M8LC85_9BACT|nr:MAG: hypothetical protein COV01_01945 [Candidatus Taylorbacteria bacterium CG10_big_fil_rev_8_21_14_0_10_41_48]
MSAQDDKVRNIKLLRYGELLARKARAELATQPPESVDLTEMEHIRKELNLSAEAIVQEVEALVKKNY